MTSESMCFRREFFSLYWSISTCTAKRRGKDEERETCSWRPTNDKRHWFLLRMKNARNIENKTSSNCRNNWNFMIIEHFARVSLCKEFEFVWCVRVNDLYTLYSFIENRVWFFLFEIVFQLYRFYGTLFLFCCQHRTRYTTREHVTWSYITRIQKNAHSSK